MVVISFILAVCGVLLALLILMVLNRATYVRGRVAMARELGAFLDDANMIDLDHATGTWSGMPVRIALNRYSIDYEVELPTAKMPYVALLARFGGRELAHRMRELELTVDAKDRMVGSFPRENGLAESLISVEKRIAIAGEIRALRGRWGGGPLSRVSVWAEAEGRCP